MIKIYKYGEVDNSEIFSRVNISGNVSEIVTQIIENVKTNKDEALKFYAQKFDGVKLDNLLVTEQEIEDAFNKVDKKFNAL